MKIEIQRKRKRKSIVGNREFRGIFSALVPVRLGPFGEVAEWLKAELC
jgi:hypothetical protein